MSKSSVLPDDVLYETFTFLSGTRLDVMRRVCKSWNNLISERKLLWLKITTLTFPSCNPSLYFNNFRNAYIDLYKRHDRDPKLLEVLVRRDRGPLKTLIVDPSEPQEDFVISENPVDSGMGPTENFSVSPNGFFCAFASTCIVSGANRMSYCINVNLIQRYTTRTTSQVVFMIDTGLTYSFYLYWTPNSRYLTWLGAYYDKNGVSTSKFALWMVDIHQCILERIEPIDGNYMLGMEKVSRSIDISCPDALRVASPLFYNLSHFPKIFIHDSKENLGVLCNGEYQPLSDDIISCGGSCPPLILSNGTIISSLKKKKGSTSSQIVLMDSKGKVLKTYLNIEHDGMGYMILSPDEKYFLYAFRREILCLYSVDGKKEINFGEKYPNMLEFTFCFFAEYQSKLCVIVHFDDGQTMKWLWRICEIETENTWDQASFTQTPDFLTISSFFDQYSLSNQYVSGEYFLSGGFRKGVDMVSLHSTSPSYKPRVLYEISHIIFVPNKK